MVPFLVGIALAISTGNIVFGVLSGIVWGIFDQSLIGIIVGLAIIAGLATIFGINF